MNVIKCNTNLVMDFMLNGVLKVSIQLSKVYKHSAGLYRQYKLQKLSTFLFQ